MMDTLSDRDNEVEALVEENARVLAQAEKVTEDIRRIRETSQAELRSARRVLRRAGYLHGASV